MFLRLLFLLLIALNMGVAAWLTFAHAHHHAVAPTDPGVPELKLLSETTPAAAGSTTTVGSGAPAAADDRCFALGPYDTQTGAQQLLGRLRAHVKRARVQEQTTDQTTGWWVYLPAFATREQALAAARKLSADGVKDYYVVTAGDRSNTVSLGLFHDPANAHHRFDRIAALGFRPKLDQRTESMPEYWVELAVARTSTFDWHTQVTDPDVQSRKVSCF